MEIISRQRQGLRGNAVKEFGPDGGTIGRSLQTDWPLPDGQRFLSGHHASIDFRSGSYYIVDTSTNGVFINGATEPVGKGKPQRLFSGDTIRIGEYEMRVEIETADSTMETLYDHDHVDPVDARQRVDSPDPTGQDLVDAFEITGVGLEFEIDAEDADTLTPLGYSFDTSELALEADADDAAGEPAGSAIDAPAVSKPPGAAGSHAAARDATAAVSPKPAAPASKAARPAAADGRPGKASAAPKPASVATGQANAASKPANVAPGPASTASKPANVAPDPASAASKPVDARAKAAARAPKTAARSNELQAAAPAARPQQTRSEDDGQPATSRPPQSLANGAAIAAFCEGAGIPASALRGEDPRQTFLRLGQTFRALLGGLTESLQLRSLQKARLKQPQTVIQQRDNNLLKFSANAGEALTRLLATQTDEYLDPVSSVRDAFADINLHQRAVLKVLPEVLGRYLEQLDPDALEDKFASAGRNRLLGAANKLRYWDLYRDVYLVMSAQASDELPEAFVDMLSAALEREIAAAKASAEAADLAQAVG